MNGDTTNTRRRRNPSSHTSTYDGDFSQRLHTSSNLHSAAPQTISSHDDGGQHKKRSGGRLFRKKSLYLIKLRRICAKIGNLKLRAVDMLFIIAVVAKLISVLYSWGSNNNNKTVAHRFRYNRTNAYDTESSIWALPKWVVRWRHHKMPFFEPILYRRGDDYYDYYDSNIDDNYYQDPNVHNSQQTDRILYKGMFRGSTYKQRYLDSYDANKRKINRRGYAFVDDAIYNAEATRHETSSALKMSSPLVNEKMTAPLQVFLSVGTFDVLDEDGTAPHYIDDDKFDTYYAFDDDFVRGTHGMGLYSDYKDGDHLHTDDEWQEDEEEEPVQPTGYKAWHEKEGAEETVCTRPIFYRGNHPTCNELHSLASGYTWLIGEEVYSRRWKNRKQLSRENALLSKFLGAGYYRHAFLLERIVGRDHDILGTNEEDTQNQWDDVVFKIMQQLESDRPDGPEASSDLRLAEDDEVRSQGWGYDPSDKYTYMTLIEYMRIDSNVMEVLTPSSRAANIFSYCGTSSITEFTPIDIEDYVYPTLGNTPKKIHHEPDEYPYVGPPLNAHISPEEKLEIALEMAKCLAAMHGYKDGPIVNADVQLGMFFRGKDGKIKIVDYNRAEPRMYDTKKEAYCKWRNGVPTDGSLRAPEENVDAGLSEQIDVFSLGNVFYEVLTGIELWEGYEKAEKIRRVVEGEPMEIDGIFFQTFSFEVLAQAILLCWTYDAEERPTIFEIIKFLEQGIESNLRNPHGGSMKERLASGEEFDLYGGVSTIL